VSGFREDEIPDVQMFLLPGQAYLRSLLEQNLPTRRAALADARAYFDACGDDYERRLALVGLIGEALQLVEDTGALGNSFFRSPPGVGFFALAATYSPSAINVFYDGLHKRPLSDFVYLAVLGMGDRWIHEAFVQRPERTAEEISAMIAAHQATAKLLRDHLLFLRQQWSDFRRYFHAFKHGMLVADPRDATVLTDDEQTELGHLVVWRRKVGLPEGFHAIEPPFEPIADWLDHIGKIALEVIDFLARQRLQIFEHVEINPDGSWRPRPIDGLPWIWWLRSDDLSEEDRAVLADRFGLSFS
jgi:hypothetical protein